MFTSFRAGEIDADINSHGPWTWKTGYQNYHSAGTLLPATGEQQVSGGVVCLGKMMKDGSIVTHSEYSSAGIYLCR
jgi:hypothetical protein